MNGLVILSQREQEYLLRAIESSVDVRDLSRFFLWTQGQFQALLPHRIMACLHFDEHDVLQRGECLHGTPLAPALRRQLLDAHDGMALRLAQRWRGGGQALLFDAHDRACPLADELRLLGLDNVLLHGTPSLRGGASVFALFGLPQRPGPREAYFLQLLLPYLHLGWQALLVQAPHEVAQSAARPASARECEVLFWVREGKSNEEVGQILGISGCTVKNHLQRIYRTLGVSNRTQAVTRGAAMRLFDLPAGLPPAV